MAVGTILGAIGGIAGGILGFSGARKQAKAAEQATAAAIAEQRRQFDISFRTLQPWFHAGGAAVQRLAFLLGLDLRGGQIQAGANATAAGMARGSRLGGQRAFLLDGGEIPGGFGIPPVSGTGTTGTTGDPTQDPEFGSLMRDFGLSDFTTDPGYEFRLSEGQKALERSAAARGGLFGGGTLRALSRYNQDFASNEFGNAYNRFQTNRATRYNFLANLAGMGQVSAGQVANLAGQQGANISNLIVGGGTAAAAARASGYGALGAGISGGLNWLALSNLFNRGASGGCWIFSAIYGQGSLRTKLLWSWLTSPTGWASESPLGKMVEKLYFLLGERVAKLILKLGWAKALRPLFNAIIRKYALPWAREELAMDVWKRRVA